MVFLGGCVGGAARMAIDLAVASDAWAWDIVAINVVGSALLGAVLGWFSTRVVPWWAPGLGPGVLGGFTTFSALASPHPEHTVPALWALGITLAASTVAAAVGWAAGERAGALRHPGVPIEEDDAVEAEVEGFAAPGEPA